MRKQSAISEQITCEVAFHDLDLTQVVWHGHYLHYLENARWALMRAVDFDLPQMMESGYLWPVIDPRVRYVRAARYQDRLQVRASLVEWEQRLTINYLITDLAKGDPVARAQTSQVAVSLPRNEMLLAVPPCFTERVQKYLATRIAVNTAATGTPT